MQEKQSATYERNKTSILTEASCNLKRPY